MEETVLTADELKTAQEVIEELLQKLGVEATTNVTQEDESIQATLETEDSGIIIGYHGEILESLQLLTSLMVAKKVGKFARVSIEVGDYKKNRTEYLERLAVQAKDRAISENRPQTLSQLKSWERRIIHLMFQDDQEVTSESSGDGKDRVLIITPKA